MRTNSKTTAVSATREDYIRAIYTLNEAGESAGVTNLASKLELSKSTVSERLKDLVQAGLVTADPYAEVELTKRGVDLGRRLTFKHRTIEVFLHTVLKIPKSKVHQEAHRLEHACSDEVIQRLAKFLQNPTTDPHGSEIPKIDNWKDYKHN